MALALASEQGGIPRGSASVSDGTQDFTTLGIITGMVITILGTIPGITLGIITIGTIIGMIIQVGVAVIIPTGDHRQGPYAQELR